MVELTLLDAVVGSSLLLTLGYVGATYLQGGKSWWGSKKSSRNQSRKTEPSIKSSPGITVARKADLKSGNSNSAVSTGTGSSGAVPDDGRSSWERSKAKSQYGYYQAHHSKLPNDGIASSEYVMNGPKPLGKKVVTSRLPTKITSYSYEDSPSEVKLEFRQEGWDWSEVNESEVTADWSPSSARLTIDSAKYGLHVASFTALHRAITGVAVRKMKRCLRLVLVKKVQQPWRELQGGVDLDKLSTTLEQPEVD